MSFRCKSFEHLRACRFLLNDEELEAAVAAAGVPALRLPFEMMTLFELVSVMQSLTVRRLWM